MVLVGEDKAVSASMARSNLRAQPVLLALLTLATAAIFAFDTISPETVSAAVLYVLVVMASSAFTRAGGVIAVATGCALLTVLSFVIAHHGHPWSEAMARCAVSLVANAITTILVLKGQEITRDLERTRDAADAANRAKTEFLANMSHEIRTPLNGVLGVADVLARTPLTDEQREMVEVVLCSSRTLETLLADILDIARVEAGKMPIQIEPFDLRRTINNVFLMAQTRGQEQGLSLYLQIDDDVPTGVYGDESRLKQVLGNLLSNAIKFTPQGEVSLRVTNESSGPFSQLCFAVCDTGIGIDPEVLPQLFRRFVQADRATTRRFGGSGLGLAISRDLAVLMGGSLEAQSTVGQGSCFRLRLPLEVAVLEAADPAPEYGDETLADLRVLLAEDNAVNARVVNMILGAIGVQPVWVGDGLQALEYSAAERFDLVLMDLQMPVMGGLEAIRTLRARHDGATPSDVPVLVLSANAMPEDVAAAKAAGASGHVSKPLTASTLLEAVQAQLLAYTVVEPSALLASEVHPAWCP